MAFISGDPKELEALNKVYEGISVSPGYDVAFAICGQYFRMTSPNGRIKLAVVEGDEASPKKGRWSRYLIDSPKTLATLNNDNKENNQRLQEASRIMLIGDQEQWEALQNELKPHVSRLKSCLSSSKGGQVEAESALKPMVEAHSQARKRFLPTIGSLSPDQVERLPANEQRWVHFSAVSAMTGNVGQSNYTASNSNLLGKTFYCRMTQPEKHNMSIMWGVIAGIGMRWKAFASADFADASIALSMDDARAILNIVMVQQRMPPEFFTGALLGYLNVGGSGGEQALLEQVSKQNQASQGVDSQKKALFDDDVNINSLLVDMEQEMGYGEASGGPGTDEPEVPVEEVEAEQESEQEPWDGSFGVGDRIEFVGFVNPLNGLTGTLTKPMNRGDKWRVKMDDNSTDKIVQEKHLKVISAAPRPKASAPKDVSPSGVLRSFLETARPDWWGKELEAAQAKLAKVNIFTVEDLVESLHSKGLNEKFSAVGEKHFSPSTMEALCETASQ